MPSRRIPFKPGEYYHIYNRGPDRGRIFFENENYLFLLNRINKYSHKFNISVLVYCLMPNHYHFLLRQNSHDTISVFMQRIFNSYTKAINKRYNRSGTLFEGRFKSKIVSAQAYLLHLCAYIHRNPLQAGLSSRLGDWAYSNLPEWLGLRKGALFKEKFRNELFTSEEKYLVFLEAYNSPDDLSKFISFE